MRFNLSALIAALLLFSALPALASEAAALQGTVTWVYDGDTLEIEPHGKVRLIGIDTPENEDSGRDRYLLAEGVTAGKLREVYRAAKDFNISQVKRTTVELTFDDDHRDRYGRLLAYVHLADGRMLNRVLLEKGLAVVYRRFAFRWKEDFLKAEAAARKAHLGLWEGLEER